MPRLVDLARVLRSKNAGPLYVTFDVMFPDRGSYETVVRSGIVNGKLISELFKVEQQFLEIIEYPAANALKITIPRRVVSGDLGDTDVYGAQQHAPLLDVEIA